MAELNHKSIVAVLFSLAFILGIFPSATVFAQPSGSAPAIINALPSTYVYTPGTPVLNVFAPNSIVYLAGMEPALFFQSTYTDQFIPVLATGYKNFPQNKTTIVYIRKGLYWYNGSATIPFTAWDVYTMDYIYTRVYGLWNNVLNATTGMKVLNNYTIEFVWTQWVWNNPDNYFTNSQSTPYPIWKPILQKIQAMNQTEATSAATQNMITEFNPGNWQIGPYYMSKITSGYIVFSLEPPNLLATWDSVFPYHTWQYYSPNQTDWFTGGIPQTLNAMLAHQATFTGAIDLSPAQVNMVNSSGIGVYEMPTFTHWGILLNSKQYPWDIPQVRQALAYAINRTAAVDAWGAQMYMPDWYGDWFVPYLYNTLPPQIQNVVVNYSYNPAKAAQILTSLGFYKKGGDWYTPNGTELALSIQGPSGQTDWMTMAEVAANQLTEFGIPSSVYADDPSSYWGVIVPGAKFEACLDNYPSVQSYSNAWASIGYPPWWIFPTWNLTTYDIQYPNGTTGTINLNNVTFGAYLPGTPQYTAGLEQLSAFFQYQMPLIPIAASISPVLYSTSAFNLSWVFKLPFMPAQSILSAVLYGYPGALQDDAWPMAFGITPPGVPSPLAQAIQEHAVNPVYAAFLGLPSSDSENYVAASTTLSLSVSASKLQVNTPVTLSSTATFTNGTPVVNESLSFYVNGTMVGTANTGVSGAASVTYTPSKAGSYMATVSVTTLPTIKSAASYFTVTPVPTNYTLYGAIAVVILLVVIIAFAYYYKDKKRNTKGPESEAEKL